MDAAQNDLARNRPGDAVRRKIAELQPNAFLRFVNCRLPGSEIRSWHQGLIGELVTGRRLNRLKLRGWRILHAVQWDSGSDIDHLAIGPAGVFAINSKHHKGKSVWYGDRAITVNGTSTRYVAISQSEAKRVSQALSRHCGFQILVRPVISVVHAAKVKVKNAAPPVLVLSADEINRTLSGLLPTLTRDQIDRIYTVARNPRTWSGA
ncbi:nuclease-related domain-containing protein [Streptomyces ipomoeae]|uniref:NERD domain-containing protein n=1 Tax=Streptomyces ipomoeae 91-03 TaxID=698759 RepID=L1KLA5_9ACTN|nr:nuclease-related domain-containing protein [Streptomyces ipomoeae]EKX61173.1 hypothetical protein STRIP9103_03654 [Streptomyces ipomoeae 91-03]MDX2696866.1 nuclease-related domain-containing protein [Streptomyces ipomoeae]MDX2825496.1 nuclease-related domain-containing protein [Streptomyces ipomoeae]MDX2842940.1 nuclease-related domain-containing protein [Streptomyces ipomoeae]MDX2842941.1 nuclease-related domain-containing protein [Streptomyces ipomoeae]